MTRLLLTFFVSHTQPREYWFKNQPMLCSRWYPFSPSLFNWWWWVSFNIPDPNTAFTLIQCLPCSIPMKRELLCSLLRFNSLLIHCHWFFILSLLLVESRSPLPCLCELFPHKHSPEKESGRVTRGDRNDESIRGREMQSLSDGFVNLRTSNQSYNKEIFVFLFFLVSSCFLTLSSSLSPSAH